MEAVRTSETSVDFYETTRRNIPEACNLHTRRRENLKSHCLSFNSAFKTVKQSLSKNEDGLIL
jgi:hypothetical protein